MPGAETGERQEGATTSHSNNKAFRRFGAISDKKKK
jgi:hypothetical protein